MHNSIRKLSRAEAILNNFQASGVCNMPSIFKEFRGECLIKPGDKKLEGKETQTKTFILKKIKKHANKRLRLHKWTQGEDNSSIK